MSTKLYAGLKIIGVDTVDKLFEMVERIRGVQQEEFKNYILKFSQSVLVDGFSKNYGDYKTCVDVASKAFISGQHEMAGVIPPQFHIYHVPGKPYMMGYPSGVRSDDVFEKLCEFSEFSDYGYWDNSDRPDEVTVAEWRERKLDWNSVIEMTLNDAGFTVGHGNEYDSSASRVFYDSKKELNDYMLSQNDRILRRVLTSEVCSSLIKRDRENETPSEIFALYHDAVELVGMMKDEQLSDHVKVSNPLTDVFSDNQPPNYTIVTDIVEKLASQQEKVWSISMSR